MFKCDTCAKTFSRLDNLNRHQQKRAANSFVCNICDKSFSRKDALNRQEEAKMNIQDAQPCNSEQRQAAKKPRLSVNQVLSCDLCKIEFNSKAKYIAHLKSKQHIECEGAQCTGNVELIKSAFKSRIATYRITANQENVMDIKTFLNNNKSTCIELIREKLDKSNSFKVNFEVFAYYVKPSSELTDVDENVIKTDLKSFNSKYKVITIGTDLQQVVEDFYQTMMRKTEEFQERDSGWALHHISHLIVNINKYDPFRGGTYIPLPKEIIRKKTCINIVNNDNACIAWCIVAALYPVNQHANRTEQYANHIHR